MILRLFRARAAVDDAAEVARYLRGPILEAARGMEGLLSVAAGMRVDSDAVRFILASTWVGVEAVVRQTGGDLGGPAAPLPDYITPDGSEHLELVTEPILAHIASPDAVIRIARMRVRADREEEFYAIVRRGLADREVRDDLLAYHLGRRVTDGHEAVAVSVWRSEDALGLLVPEAGAPLWRTELEPVLESFEVEHFGAVTVGAT